MDEESLEKDRQKSRYEEEKREMVKLLQGVVESNIGVGILSVFLISTSMLMWHTRGTYLPIFFVAVPILIFGIMIDVELVVSIYLFFENVAYRILVFPYDVFKITFCNKFCCCCCRRASTGGEGTPPPNSSSSICKCYTACWKKIAPSFARIFSFFYGVLCCQCCRRSPQGHAMSVQKNVDFREVKPKALPKKSVRAEEQNKSTIVEQLIDLSKLKADGVLTEEEFVLAKQKILKGSKGD